MSGDMRRFYPEFACRPGRSTINWVAAYGLGAPKVEVRATNDEYIALGAATVCEPARMVRSKPMKERVATATVRINEKPTTVVIQPGVVIPTSLRPIEDAEAKIQKATRPDAARMMRVSTLSTKVDTAPNPSVMSATKVIRD